MLSTDDPADQPIEAVPIEVGLNGFSGVVAHDDDRMPCTMHREVRCLPCAPECPNWLRYGITPNDPEPGMLPGHCPRPAHDLENLGHGGRRVLVSRDWSGKTLAEHKADRAAIVRAALTEAGIEPPDTDRWSADHTGDDGIPRYAWEPVDITPGSDLETYRVILRRQITERLRWHHEYAEAKQALDAARPPNDTRSATGFADGVKGDRYEHHN